MRPVHEFQENFSQAEPATHSQPDGLADALTLHEADSTVRNLCLVWPDGRKAFFNYAYLVEGGFDPNGDVNIIKLMFSSYTVTLRGYALESLFIELLDHLPRIITAIDPRYAIDDDKQTDVVISIVIEKQDG